MAGLKEPPVYSGIAEWWHVDSKGRKIGWLWPEDAKAILDGIWGNGKGIKNYALLAGMSRTMIQHYCCGHKPIPKHHALLITMMQDYMTDRDPRRPNPNKRHTAPLILAPWLEKDDGADKVMVDSSPYP